MQMQMQMQPGNGSVPVRGSTTEKWSQDVGEASREETEWKRPPGDKHEYSTQGTCLKTIRENRDKIPEELANEYRAAVQERNPVVHPPGGSVAAGAPMPSAGSYKERLNTLVTQRLKRHIPSGFIKYTEEQQEEGEFISTVTVRWATGTDNESTFTGSAQPRKVAAQHDAARVALETLTGSG